jgi:cobalt/nickel transport system ATP-binding protein
VLDEPFEGLDPASRADLVHLLNQLHRDHGVTLVMATHDVNVVKAMADVVYVLRGGGEIVAQGAPEAVFRDPALLRGSNIEPPVLADLFQRLDERGLSLGRPLTVEDASRVLLEWGARQRAARPVPAPPHGGAPQPSLPFEGGPAPGAAETTARRGTRGPES